jgi:hypothetical protein
VPTWTNYWFHLQVHIDFIREICIFCKDIWKNIYFVHVAEYLICVFMKYLVIVTSRSNLSYYWVCDTSINTTIFLFVKCIILKKEDCNWMWSSPWYCLSNIALKLLNYFALIGCLCPFWSRCVPSYYSLRFRIKVMFGEISLKLSQTNWNVGINNVERIWMLLLMNYQVK